MNIAQEQVIAVRHWSESLFSFKTTRDPGFRFENGHFVMLGLEVEGRPLMRAYSIVSANYDPHLEFLSIKAPQGPLTSRLQAIRQGSPVLVSRKPTGTLVLDDLKPGKRLYLLSTGTGLAPFLSIVRDPVTYERFDKVVLVHGVRFARDLAYRDHLLDELPNDEILGEEIRHKLIYLPTVTREPYPTMGRLTDLIESGLLTRWLGLPDLDPATDRVMLCGSTAMLRDTRGLLDDRGFCISPHRGQAGDYVIERAFVES